MKPKDNTKTMKCLFVNFEDYERFCLQINKPDFIHAKTIKTITFEELKRGMLRKNNLENFYE